MTCRSGSAFGELIGVEPVGGVDIAFKTRVFLENRQPRLPVFRGMPTALASLRIRRTQKLPCEVPLLGGSRPLENRPHLRRCVDRGFRFRLGRFGGPKRSGEEGGCDLWLLRPRFR